MITISLKYFCKIITKFFLNPLTPRIHYRVSWKNGPRSAPGHYFGSLSAWSPRSWAPPHICLSRRAQLTTQFSWCPPSMEGTSSVWVIIFKYMFMYLEIIFSTKTQFKSFHYIPNSVHSLKNSPFCDILGAKFIYKVKQHYCVGAVFKGA